MDFIEKYDKVLSKEKCEQIIYLFESNSSLHEVGLAGGKVNLNKKKSTSLDFTFDRSKMQSKDMFLADALGIPLLNGIERYKKKHKYLNDVTQWSLNVDYHMQRFDRDDGYFATHCEQEGHTSKRIIAWMFYLNDAKCGTKFYYQNKTFKAKQGRMLIWPAAWTHMHSGVIPNLNTKYIITGWYSFVS